LMAWSRYVKVAAIFEKRKQRLKWLGRACAPWIAGGMWVISVVASRYVAVPRNLTFSAWVHLGTVAALTVSVLYYFASSHSIVYLRTPHRFAWRRWLDDHKPEVVVGLAGALLGTLAARSLEKSLEITFHSTQLFLR